MKNITNQELARLYQRYVLDTRGKGYIFTEYQTKAIRAAKQNLAELYEQGMLDKTEIPGIGNKIKTAIKEILQYDNIEEAVKAYCQKQKDDIR